MMGKYSHYDRNEPGVPPTGSKKESVKKPAPVKGEDSTPPPSKPGWVEKYVLKIVQQAILNHEQEYHAKK